MTITEPTLTYTDDFERAAHTLNKAFKDSRSNDYLMKKFFNIPLTENVSQGRIKAILEYFAAFYHDNGAEIAEANDFNTVAIYTTPEKPVDQWMTNDSRFNQSMFLDLGHKKHEIIPDHIKYYYLFIVGRDLTDTSSKKKGALRKIFETYKQKADDSNSAIVLEAISESAKSVYEYFGFKSYLKFNYGKGEVNAQGEPDKNGCGFDAYLMIYYKDTFPGFLE
ncbi:hypothetical protein ACO0RG_004316 [Hanseniaspora osmophila]|uniref:N-acetyltransferase domain-containing protein n=1 Tax=Hanseniaspora osmophila TaxID=56408 RepID=A0A1E5RBA7_9ASCO|nr:Uncharacterized protein AWRI3579_g2940 [Hanseniaspora osmophila]